MRRKASYLEAGRILGGMLGEKIYVYYRSGMIALEDVLEFLRKDVLESDFHDFYQSVIIHIDSLPSLAKSKTERL